MNRIMRIVLQILGSTLFGTLVYAIAKEMYDNNSFGFQTLPFFTTIIVGFVLAIIFYISFSSFFADALLKLMSQIEERLVKMNIRELAISTVGVMVGLVIANLIGLAISKYGVVGTAIATLLNVVFALIGFRVAQQKKDELPNLPVNTKPPTKSDISGKPKVLDTSVIIDGRILDIMETGFIEGRIIIPAFVLDELRHIADSSDSLKRNRGRRGLDALNKIQKQLKLPVETLEWDPKDTAEVDVKLLKMAKKLNGFVVTNDYNLNKVANFQGVRVLNINELSNALKPVALPGEDMTVAVIKDGKEDGQGIGYLNDGTMIVVEGGKKYIGETIDVSVTSALQTAAGRMIFTKKKD